MVIQISNSFTTKHILNKNFAFALICHRHERKFHPQFVPTDDITDERKIPDKSDHLHNYHCAKLRFGLLLFDLNDAVQEGDGQRLHDIYKLALLLYKSGGHFKYAYIVVLHLVKVAALYSKFTVAHRDKTLAQIENTCINHKTLAQIENTCTIRKHLHN